MWKIFFFQIIFIATKSSYAADVYCSAVSATQQCTFDKIINVASASDTINVIGQASNFIDTVTTRISTTSTSTFSIFPYNIFNTFSNLVDLILSDNKWTTLTANSFGSCGKLQFLWMNQQLITELPAGFAQNCASLITLHIANLNLTSKIDSNALLGLSNLTGVIFHGCGITCLPSGLFDNTPALQRFTLLSNKVVSIDPALFRGLPNLNEISLSHNLLGNIPVFDLTGTSTNSKKLIFRINDNPVKAVNPQFVNSLFNSRTNYLTLYSGNYAWALTTCFSSPSMLDNANYTAYTDTYYSNCFSNWTPDMQNYTPLCGTTTTTSTTTTTTTSPPTTSTTTTTLPPTTVAPPPCTPSPPPCSPPCCQKSIMDILVYDAHSFSVNFS